MTGLKGMATGRKKSRRATRSDVPRDQSSIRPKSDTLQSVSFPPAAGPIWPSLLDPLAEPAWVMDAEYRIQQCNQAAHQLFGDPIIGQRCWDVVHCTEERISACPLSAGPSIRRESADLAIGERWFRCTIDPLFDLSGALTGTLHILWDITDRRDAESALLRANETLEQRVADRTAELGKANERLRQSEQNLRRFIEHAPVAIAMFDRRMHYLAVSGRWLSDYGLQGRDLEGRSHYDIFPNLPERWKSAHKRTLAGEVVQAAEDRFERPDGSSSWQRWELQPWFDNAGAIGGIVMFTEDITERVRLSQEALQARDRMRADVEAMTILHRLSMITAEGRDLQGVLAEVVKAAIAITGADGGNLQLLDPTTSRLKIVTCEGLPESWTEYWNHLQAQAGTCGIALEKRERVIVEDVETSPIFAVTPELKAQLRAGVRAVQSTPLISRTGKALGVFSTHYMSPHRPDEHTLQFVDLLARQASDLIESAQAEAALRKSHERLKKVLETETVGVMFWDPASGVMIDANDTFLRLTGYSRHDVEAHELNWQKLTPPEFIKVSQEELEKFATTDRVGPYEKEYLCKDGTRRWFVFAGSALDDGTIVEFCVDVSARKQAEARLRETKEQIHYFINNTRDILFQIDLKGNCTFGNVAAERVTGYLLHDLLQMNVMQLVTPEYHGLLKDRLQRRIAGRLEEKPLELEIQHKDGHRIWLELTTTGVSDSEGQLVAIQGVARDISERKKSERELRAVSTELRRILETAATGLNRCSRDLHFLSANPAYARLVGQPLKEIVGRPMVDVIGAKALEVTRPYIDRVLRGERVEYEALVPYVRSHNRWLHFVYTPDKNNRGEVVGWVASVTDITKRKRTEEALYDANEFKQQIFSGVNEGVIVLDRDLKIQAWNPFMEKLAGPPASAVIGKHVLKAFPPLRELGVANLATRALAGEVVAPRDFPIPLHSNGQPGWASHSFMPLRNAKGEIVGVIVIVRDITVRKQMELMLQQTNRTLNVIRDCHEAMLRAESEPALLNEICRVIVHTGGERLAWVGYAEADAAKSVRVAAAVGSASYLSRLQITWADEPRGRGPIGVAIRTGKASICNNTQTDPMFAPWREDARRHGMGSTIALPLIVDGQCIGALSIYAPAPDAFNEVEQQRLMEFANDLAFGITALRLRTERTRLENEMLKSIERERERIGRDLHDGIGQLLTSIKLRCGYLKDLSPARLSEVKQEVTEMESVLKQTIEQVRGMAQGLNPVRVTSAGLAVGLLELADEASSAGGPKCVCKVDRSVKISNHQTIHHLYRIAQEALQNAIKHADAKKITITLKKRSRGILLSVEDDGAGMPTQVLESGMGLSNMQMRASLIGARLAVSRRKNGGTVVMCEFTPPK